MTVECEQIIHELGFKNEDYRVIEYYLTKASPQRVIQAVRKYSKGEKRTADWYMSLFKSGYIKSPYKVDCSWSKEFWETYEILDTVCEMHTFDIPYIDEMSKSRSRLKKALHTSKVMNVRYIYKVWENIPEEKIVNNVDKVCLEFKSNVIKVVEL